MANRTTFDLSVYFILDPSLCAGRNYIDVAVEAVRGGATLVQLRDKKSDRDILLHHANTLRHVMADFDVPFIMNDDVEVALEVDASGVHLGQDDMSPAQAREILGEGKIIGVTAFTAAQIGAIDPDIVDYVGTGPVYPTLTKPDKAVLGVEAFSELLDCSTVPVVGIGGITQENAAAVIEAGADGVAMMRSISEADDVRESAYAFINTVAAARLQEAL